MPVYDHIVIVVEENKDYGKIGDDDEDSYIVGNPNAPFINGTLRAERRCQAARKNWGQTPYQGVTV